MELELEKAVKKNGISAEANDALTNELNTYKTSINELRELFTTTNTAINGVGVDDSDSGLQVDGNSSEGTKNTAALDRARAAKI
jgi:hypothetical protein